MEVLTLNSFLLLTTSLVGYVYSQGKYINFPPFSFLLKAIYVLKEFLFQDYVYGNTAGLFN